MPVVETEVQSQVIQLSTEAFNGFCEDVSGMFDVKVECLKEKVHTIKLQDLKSHFDEIVAINTISAAGATSGKFFFIFDQKGLFTLPGLISMTSEKTILQNIEKGDLKQAESMNEALAETGNLLVGSWDRIFRQDLIGHERLVQSASFIGTPWDDSEKSFGLAENQEIIFISYKMTIGSYPAFKCGVCFPKDFVNDENERTSDIEQIQQPSENPEKTEPQERQNIEHPLSDMVAGSAGKSISSSAKDIMQKNVIWISPDNTVEDAIAKMKEHDAGYLMVGSDDIIEGRMLEGIVSRSDIAGAVSPYLRSTFAKWRRPIDDATLQIRIKWIMSRPVRTVKLDTPVNIIMEQMSRYGGRCLPVVDDKAAVVGLVTVFEIFNSLLTDNGISIIGKAGQPPLFV
ncbi:MAG: CBS domain-containing protein [Planctomycetota bacterium]|jgi:CBS domain-containing protein